MSNKMYDILKWVSIICIPAIGWFYSEIANIWQLPYGTEITKTIFAIGTLLGALLGISTINYNKKQNQLKQDEMEEDDIEAIEGDDEE